jgi:branched-chain amino acid transport system permease protein
MAFIVSATLTGLAGSLYAIWAQTANSSMSSVDETIVFLAMIVVGGLGSILGSVLGALFVGFLPLLLGQLPSPIAFGGLNIQVSTLTTGIYGMLLLLALIFFPAGLASGRDLFKSLLARGALMGGGR